MEAVMKPPAVDISAVINEAPFSHFQRTVLATCFVLMMLDTIDATLMAFAAPAISGGWHVPIAKFGPVFGAALLGSLLGSLIFGQAADTLGRRFTLIAGVSVFGIFTLLQGTANSMQTLIIYRLIAGLGLGGVVPNAVATVSEYAPARIRPMVINSMSCGLPLGSALAGFIAFAMLAPFGWRATFYVCGLVPIVLVPFLIWRLPESIRFLALKKSDPKQLARIMRKIAPTRGFGDGDEFVLNEQRIPGSPAKNLFTGGRLVSTLLLWVLFFVGYLLTYLLLSWLPSLLRQSGIPLKRAIFIGAIFSVGGAIGGLVLGWYSRRVDGRRVMGYGFVFACVFIAALGFSQGHVAAVVATVFFAGFFLTGSQMTMYSVASATYRTSMRSTGVGWASGFGRIGSIIGPVVGGILLGTGTSVAGLLYITAAPALIGSVAAFLLVRERQDGLETVSVAAPLGTTAKA
jgi:AAHS family 4-hydroxybenzoate transporter-like MFS transporter